MNDSANHPANHPTNDSVPSCTRHYLVAGLVHTSVAMAMEGIRTAERVVYAEKWRVQAGLAAERLADTRSVRWVALFPGCGAVLVVAIDGRVIGRVRHHDHRWHAVLRGRRVAIRRSRRAAIAALADHADGAERRRRRPLRWWMAVSAR